ncbi:histidine kinase [Shinella sp. WSJ-2]|uniref:sensor histidine kinase n=1 Tax=Shinella sp. WSJ-2 TaxID=2303749 RepID=UPI000E3DA0DA|nr:CHASE3 domain-containing protein [Shinella sp. WSJ-2]MBO9631039.1 CHASE3 domain-containing protein [Shinella sp.]RFZ88765.1 histidine kinase [Shinella sp. WSJ-2]
MPISNAAFVRSTVILLAAGMIALLGIVGTSLWLVSKVQTYFAELVEVREVRSSASDLLSTLKDAETGQRGFVITGEATFRKPYDEALMAVAERQRALEEKSAKFEHYARRSPDIKRLVSEKLVELAETVEAVEQGRTTDAIAQVKTDRGRILMDQLREQLGAIMADADHRLQVGIVDTLWSAGALQWTTVIGAIAIIGVLGGAVLVVAQYTRDIMLARREVETLNATLERRVDERTEELIRANQEVQRFAYIVTHDLRAPLVNIMGFTSELQASLSSIQTYVLADGKPPSADDILEARRAASEDLPEAIGFIRSSTKKMDGLINAILKISRDGRRELKIERVDLKALVEMGAATVNHQVVESDGVVTIGNNLPTVISDRLSLEQVFGNLFDNAIKYQTPGRPLRISVTARNNGRAGSVIEFTDNGRGIAPEDHERVFELFRRSGTQDKPGEGIGLAHVRSLMRNLGGDIVVKSALGEGTTFVLRLPPDLSKVVRSMQA